MKLGLKSEFFDHRVLFNIAGYHIDLSDIQVVQVFNRFGALVNGGEATSDGVELTAAFEPVKGLRLGLNGAYTNSTLSNDAPSLGGLKGDRLPFIPQFSASATVDYYFPLGAKWNGHVGAGYRWVDDSLNAAESSPFALRNDGFGAVDLNADISSNHWTIRIFVKNVSDERAYPAVGAVGDLNGTVAFISGVPIQPRTVGVEFDFKF
jgi:outer membrane receptor protein involved in Fe transport